MAELMFVVKGFVLAVVVTMLLQLSVGGETLETKSDRMLHNSVVGHFLNQTADGAVRVLHEGKRTVSGWMGQTSKKENASAKSQGE